MTPTTPQLPPTMPASGGEKSDAAEKILALLPWAHQTVLVAFQIRDGETTQMMCNYINVTVGQVMSLIEKRDLADWTRSDRKTFCKTILDRAYRIASEAK